MAGPRQTEQDVVRLRELGFNPAAPAAEALRCLGELRASGGISGIAIARALGSVEDGGAVRMLLEMEDGASGALRREIRRSLFRLSRRGIARPASGEPAGRRESADGPSSEPGFTACISPPDVEGTQLVWLLKPRPGGGVVRLTGLVSGQQGLLGVGVATMTRRELRAERKELEQRSGLRLIEAVPALADFILCDAYRRTPVERRGPVGDFYALRAEFTAAPAPSEFAHPVYSELAAEAAGEPSPGLLQEPEVATFRIPAAGLKPWVEEVNRAREGLIVVSAAAQRERVMAVVGKAANELLRGELAVRLRRQLEDAAYYMMRDGRRAAAGWACAAAARIRGHAGLGDLPFFRALVEAQLGAALAEEAERKEAEPRLIMTPAEAIRAQEEQGAPMAAPRR